MAVRDDKSSPEGVFLVRALPTGEGTNQRLRDTVLKSRGTTVYCGP